MNTKLNWGAAIAASLSAHGLLGLGLATLLEPLPVAQQRSPTSSFELATQEVARRDAFERAFESTATTQFQPPTEIAAGQGVPQRTAQPVTGSSASIAASAAAGVLQSALTGRTVSTAVKAGAPAAGLLKSESLKAKAVSSDSMRPVAVDADSVGALRIKTVERPAGPVLRAVAGTIESAQSVTPGRAGGTTIEPHPYSAKQLRAARPAGQAIGAAIAPLIVAGPGRPAALRLESGTRPVSPMLAAFAPTSQLADAANPPKSATPLVAATGTRLKPSLQWSGAGQVHLDSNSIAALQAFMTPDAIETDGHPSVRDRIAEAMAGPPCARVQTVFDPETGALELRGHVPTEATRGPLIDALRANVGGGLEIQDNLRILPPPQCSMLDGLAGLGLPQSEEQLTDPHLIGENAHVREYRFQEGERLVIDLTAPEYEAYIYVDYFDAEGNVIHLVPNGRTPIRRHASNFEFSIGRASPDGAPGLEIRIGPPFGQDIAVAIASEQPLYDELRPIIEPAEPYLAFLKERVSALSQADTAIRGEWVYLFVSTRPSVN